MRRFYYGVVALLALVGLTAAYNSPYMPFLSVTLNVNHSSGTDAPTCGSSAAPCHTNYYAYQLGQTYKKPGIGGTLTIQSDCNFTESPPGAFLGNSHSGGAGGGVVFMIGNEASPSSCKWTSVGGTIVFDDGAVVSLRGFDMANSGSGQSANISVDKGGILVHSNMIFGSAVGSANVQIDRGGQFIWDGGTYQVGEAGCAPACFNFHIINKQGKIQIDHTSPAISVPSALTFSAFYEGDGSGSNGTFGPGVTFTGSGAGSGSTGQPYQISSLASLTLNSVTLPGNGTGLIGTNACSDRWNSTNQPACVPQAGLGLLFAQVPACNATNIGMMLKVADSSTVTWGATITGGGGSAVFGICDGTNWTVYAK